MRFSLRLFASIRLSAPQFASSARLPFPSSALPPSPSHCARCSSTPTAPITPTTPTYSSAPPLPYLPTPLLPCSSASPMTDTGNRKIASSLPHLRSPIPLTTGTGNEKLAPALHFRPPDLFLQPPCNFAPGSDKPTPACTLYVAPTTSPHPNPIDVRGLTSLTLALAPSPPTLDPKHLLHLSPRSAAPALLLSSDGDSDFSLNHLRGSDSTLSYSSTPPHPHRART